MDNQETAIEYSTSRPVQPAVHDDVQQLLPGTYLPEKPPLRLLSVENANEAANIVFVSERKSYPRIPELLATGQSSLVVTGNSAVALSYAAPMGAISAPCGTLRLKRTRKHTSPPSHQVW